MSESIWTVLGIAPTADLLAIKRAYAVRLKRTRPDDDAQAYQALREAYEQAQQWARWHAEEADEFEADDVPSSPVVMAAPSPTGDRALAAPDPAPTAPLASVEAVPAPEPTEEREAPAPEVMWVDTITPALKALDAAWAQGGSMAVLAAWPQLQALWDEVPLDEREQLQVAMADWTLARQTIRPELLTALAQHFGWTGDFRASRRLGWERTQALHGLMADTLDLRASNPGLAARLEPLRRLEQWRTTGAVWRMLLCMVLMGEPLRQFLRECTPALLHKLCARDDSYERLTTWFNRAFWLRASLPGWIVAIWVALAQNGWPDALFGLFLWFVLCLGLGTALVFLGRLIGSAWGMAAQGSPLQARLQGWMAHQRAPAVGAGLLLGALLMSTLPALWPDAGPWLVLSSLLLWALGVVALWPRWPGDGFVAIGAAGLVFAIAQPWWGSQPLLGLLALVSLWALLAPVVFARGWHEGRGGWAVRVVFGFATGALNLARQGGFLFALTPMALVATLRWAGVLPLSWTSLALWVAAMHLLSWGQDAANRWAAPRLGFPAA